MFAFDTAPLCHTVARAWVCTRRRAGLRSAVRISFALAASTALFASIALAPSANASVRHVRRAHSLPIRCVGANEQVGSASSQLLRSATVCLINEVRAAHHLPPLSDSWRLDRSAQGWTDSMVANGDFSHGSNFSSRISAVGFVWSNVGENIATGFPTPREVVNAWMASTGHCENILSPLYSYVGTGISRQPVSGFASGPATWTQDFGLPIGHRAPSGNWGPANGCPY